MAECFIQVAEVTAQRQQQLAVAAKWDAVKAERQKKLERVVVRGHTGGGGQWGKCALSRPARRLPRQTAKQQDERIMKPLTPADDDPSPVTQTPPVAPPSSPGYPYTPPSLVTQAAAQQATELRQEVLESRQRALEERNVQQLRSLSDQRQQDIEAHREIMVGGG